MGNLGFGKLMQGTPPDTLAFAFHFYYYGVLYHPKGCAPSLTPVEGAPNPV